MKRTKMPSLEGIRVEPQYHERVWGGDDLRPEKSRDAGPPIGEAWIVYEGNKVASGPEVGRKLGEIAKEYGAEFLGRRVVKQTGTRFPLLIKLLDCHDWLSVQVHPDDEKAVQLEGPGHLGKTEAWYFLKAEEGAQIISGIKEGITREQLAGAIRQGEIVKLAHYQPVKKGDAVLMPAGTIHALGPGLLVYEVQQTSDITYRVFDWNRPQAGGRALHIEQSITAADPTLRGKHVPARPLAEGEKQRLVECNYFTLELTGAQRDPVELDTRGESFHALTMTEGEIEIEGAGWSQVLSKHETIIVPAACRHYRLYPRVAHRALISMVQ